jgi:hypothetical protein
MIPTTLTSALSRRAGEGVKILEIGIEIGIRLRFATA